MRWRSALSSALFAMLIATATAESQSDTGAIIGIVQDVTGAVIPGVSVTLTNPGALGGNQQTISDEGGNYRFTRLIPATYSIRAELPGFRAVSRQGLAVNADKTVRVDVVLEVGEVADTVTVVGEAPMLDLTTTLNQAVLDRRVLDTLPTGGDLWSASRTVPSVLVNKYDVGGSESFQQTNLSVHGSPNTEKKFAIDGFSVNYFGGGGGTGNYYDAAMFEEVNYTVGSVGAESQEGGIVINMVTKTGTNDFHGNFFFWGTGHSLQSDNISSDLRKVLLANIPARALAANPNLVPSTKIISMFDSGLTLSGPVVRNKLWFTTSYKLNSLNQLVVGSYNSDGTQGVDDNRLVNGSIKLSWQISPKNQFYYLYDRNYKDRYHRYPAGFAEPRAAKSQTDVGYITQAKFTSMLTPSMVFDATVGYNFLHWPDEHQKEVIPGDLSRFDILTQTTTVAAASYNYQNIDRGSFAANLSYTNRRHDVKIGFATSPRTMQRQVNWGMSHFPSGMQARYRNGVPDSVDLYNTPNDSSVFLTDYAYFIQDKWKIKRLTMNLGLRLETKNGRVPAQCQPDGAFIKRTCYPEIRNVPDWMDLVPRFGMSYDIFGNGRTAFKLSANRYSITVGNTHLNRVNPLQLASNNVPWTDRNHDLIPQPDELGQGTGFDLSVYNRYRSGIQRPYNNEYTIGLQHEFPGALVGSVTFAHRDVRRNIGLRNVAVPTESYIPIAVTEPTTGSRLNVYNLAPALRTSRDNLFDNYKELDTFYNGVDLTFEKRFKGNGSLVYGGLSLGGNHGDFLPAADLNDPNNNIRRGRVDLDVPVSFKVAALFNLPHGFTVSGNGQHFTGLPELQTFLVTRTLVPTLTRTSQTLYMTPRGDVRLPNNNLLDVSFKKTIRLGENLKLDPHLDIFNLTNRATVQNRVQQLGATYHQPSSVLAPRLYRMGFKVNY